MCGSAANWITVAGVVADFRHGQGRSTQLAVPAAYVPYSFAPTLNTGVTVRVSGDATRIGSTVRDQIRQSDPSLPYNVTASDPASVGVVAVFLALVAVVASYVPAVGDGGRSDHRAQERVNWRYDDAQCNSPCRFRRTGRRSWFLLSHRIP